jgi:hypothetical protein
MTALSRHPASGTENMRICEESLWDAKPQYHRAEDEGWVEM